MQQSCNLDDSERRAALHSGALSDVTKALGLKESFGDYRLPINDSQLMIFN